MTDLAVAEEEIRRRLSDSHDALGRWRHVHPGLTLDPPLPVYTLRSGPDWQKHDLGVDAFYVGLSVGSQPFASLTVPVGLASASVPTLTSERTFFDGLRAALVLMRQEKGSAAKVVGILRVPALHATYLWARVRGANRYFAIRTHAHVPEAAGLTRSELNERVGAGMAALSASVSVQEGRAAGPLGPALPRSSLTSE